MAFFVTYQNSYTESEARSDPKNIILMETHPVLWACHPSLHDRNEGIVKHILFWSTIPDDVAEYAQETNWCPVE